MNKTYDQLISTPCRMVIAGPSGCGKTTLLQKLLTQNEIFEPKLPTKVNYHYKSSIPEWVIQNPNVEAINHIPLIDDIQENTVIIIDDWMTESAKATDLIDLFNVASRHKNVSVFLLVQNFFYKGLRNLTLSATHIVLFKSPRDNSFVKSLAMQMYPGRKDYLQAAFLHATRKPHSYLLINITQQQKEDHRLSSSFFPEEAVVYLPI